MGLAWPSLRVDRLVTRSESTILHGSARIAARSMPILRPGGLRCGHHMKSMDKTAKLAMLSDRDTKCVDLWEGEALPSSLFLPLPLPLRLSFPSSLSLPFFVLVPPPSPRLSLSLSVATHFSPSVPPFLSTFLPHALPPSLLSFLPPAESLPQSPSLSPWLPVSLTALQQHTLQRSAPRRLLPASAYCRAHDIQVRLC